MNLSELSLKEKIGQMLIVGINGTEINDEIRELILTHKVGGIILYKKNYDSYENLIKLINDIKELNKANKLPLFITIDQEGGRVNRMPKEINNILNAYTLSKTKDLNLINNAAEITGKMLKDSGFNMNLSPVLDIKRFGDTHAIGNRCYGDTPEDVCKYGTSVMHTYQKEGIIPVIKHFPGHGASTKDSHITLPVIKNKKDELEHYDMKPFQHAIEQGAEVIMLGHLLVKNIDRIYVASLSRKMIIKYLRGKYRFRGLIMTDELNMFSIKFRYGKNLIKKAFIAGNDLILTKDIHYNISKIENLVQNGKIKESRINRSIRRIIKIKEKYMITNEPVTGCNIEDINTSIDKLNGTITNRINEMQET